MEKTPKRRKLSVSPQTSTKAAERDSNEDVPPTKKGDSSPERCPICLAPPENPAKSDSCSHYFCFNCLKEWSKVKAECPLCKMPIHSIFYDIKGDDEYQEYKVIKQRESIANIILNNLFSTPTPQPAYARHYSVLGQTGAGFAARSSLRRGIEQLAMRNLHRNRENEMAAIAAATDIVTIRRRRNYYWTKTMVQRVDTGNRVRDISTEFFRDNPGQMHRLEPWLRRELTALYGYHNGSLVSRVRAIIMSTVTTIGISSPTLTNMLQPYLLEHTNQFIHEFLSFARSPYDIHQYDRHAHYTPEGHSHDWAASANRNPPSGWDSGTESGENTQGHTDQSLMLLRTTWGDDEGVTEMTHARPRRLVTGVARARPRRRTVRKDQKASCLTLRDRGLDEEFGVRECPRHDLGHHVTCLLPPRRSRPFHRRDVEAPLMHQTLDVHRPGGSSARDYQSMERIRRHLGDHLKRLEHRARRVAPESRSNPSVQSKRDSIIVISSDSGDDEKASTAASGSGSKTLHYKPSPLPQQPPENTGTEQSCHVKIEKTSKNQSDSWTDTDESSPVTDSSGSIEFVKYIKPRHLRTPEAFIELSSTDDDDAPGPSTRNTGASASQESANLLSDSSSQSSSDDETNISRSRRRKSSSSLSSQSRPDDILRKTKEFLKKARQYTQETSGNHSSGAETETEVLTAVVTSDNGAGNSSSAPDIATSSGVTSSENHPLVSSQSETKSAPKKIFERGKVSVNFPKPKGVVFDSDSDSEIDVGVEEVRPPRGYSREPSLVENSSPQPHFAVVPPTQPLYPDSPRWPDISSPNTKARKRSWSYESASRNTSHRSERKRSHERSGGPKRKKKKHKRSRHYKSSRNSDEVFQKSGTSNPKHHKKSKSVKRSKHHKRSRSSSVEFVSRVHRE